MNHARSSAEREHLCFKKEEEGEKRREKKRREEKRRKGSEDGRNRYSCVCSWRIGDTRDSRSEATRISVTPKKGSLLTREAREPSLAGATPSASSMSSTSSSARVGAAGASARHAHLRIGRLIELRKRGVSLSLFLSFSKRGSIG